MKNLTETANRIKKAAESDEGIILFGDADLDGVTSTIMLKKAVAFLEGRTTIYFSDREKWGYGLSKKAMEEIKKEKGRLLITLDCGISNFEGVELAKKYGFEVIIIDHHTELGKLPQADLVLDPNQKKDNYPFKKMANAGVVYKLVQEILGERFEKEKEVFLELAVLGTLADMVPKKEDNKKILDEGMPLLKEPSIPSLRKLREKKGELSEEAISLLNITSPVGKVNRAFLFLEAKEEAEAEKILDSLEEERRKRREKLLREEEAIEACIDKEELIVFKEGKFPPHLAGALASRVIRKAKKPVFLYSIEGDLAKGSVRSVSGYNAIEAMEYCSKYLETFGGHPEAAGFTLKKENLEEFKNCLISHLKSLSQD